jgi:AraC family transcriptional regulator, regulatory protein of adaptative response / DNA-3-methyladenine glycosylase II
MRGLGHPDVFLTNDLGVRHALDRLGLDPTAASRWSPWRSYAVHHLWASLAAPSSDESSSSPAPSRTSEETS